jgi:hypothetical protein
MVRFSELAEAGLAGATENAEQHAALRHSIILHLSHPDAVDKSHSLAGPAGKQLYVFALWKVRIIWEIVAPADVLVWSITLLRAYR